MPMSASNGFWQNVHPFLENYCTTCHSGAKPNGHFDLSAYTSPCRRWSGIIPQWTLASQKLAAQEMPPKEPPQPPPRPASR